MATGQPALNILQVASSLYDWGGIERYVVYLAQGLESRGHTVCIACPIGSPIHVRRPESLPIEMQRKLDFRGFRAYLRLFRSRRFDVVHGHFSPDFTLPAYAAKLTRQPLTIMTRHVATRWAPAKARAYARLWNHIIPVSHAVERRLLGAGVAAAQMTVAKAGVPEVVATKSRRDAREALRLEPQCFAVGSFGRLVSEKGIDTLIGAIDRVPSGIACIFGRGPEEERLRALAGPHRVRFFGQIPDVADAMNAMDVVAIPSTWEEPFPYAALEAMALGRPIVGSNIGGLPEMIDEGRNGLLFSPGDSSDLARALSELAQNPMKGEQLGGQGQIRFRTEFTVEKMAERIEAVYYAAAATRLAGP